MTAKFLASGVAAVVAIGAAVTGMTPVAMASTGPKGTQVPLTREPHAQAPANDDGSDSGYGVDDEGSAAKQRPGHLREPAEYNEISDADNVEEAPGHQSEESQGSYFTDVSGGEQVRDGADNAEEAPGHEKGPSWDSYWFNRFGVQDYGDEGSVSDADHDNGPPLADVERRPDSEFDFHSPYPVEDRPITWPSEAADNFEVADNFPDEQEEDEQEED